MSKTNLGHISVNQIYHDNEIVNAESVFLTYETLDIYSSCRTSKFLFELKISCTVNNGICWADLQKDDANFAPFTLFNEHYFGHYKCKTKVFN